MIENKLQDMESISFRKVIEKGQSVILKERVKADGTVTKVKIKFYEGQEGSLRVTPYVLKTRNRIEQLVTYAEGSDTYLSGNDEAYEQDISLKINNDDYVCISVTNTSSEYDYNLNADILVDYYGGNDRVVGGVM
jgi:hypothetical protein